MRTISAPSLAQEAGSAGIHKAVFRPSERNHSQAHVFTTGHIVS
jgi:hypothetical protein